MKYAAFLRAMNVGGRRVTNDQLCDAFALAGFEDASAFLASGNVVFEGGSKAKKTLRQQLEGALEDSLGYTVPTLLYTLEQVAALGEEQAFDEARLAGTAGKIQVMLLESMPTAAKRKKVLAHNDENDGFAFGDDALFWLPCTGISTSNADRRAIGKLLGLHTVRTQNTLRRLAKKHA